MMKFDVIKIEIACIYFDYDYFRFQLVGNQAYKLILEGEREDLLCFSMYTENGTKVRDWPTSRRPESCERHDDWEHFAVKRDGAFYEFYWTPSSSGQYYLSVHGVDRNTGGYDLKMVRELSYEDHLQ